MSYHLQREKLNDSRTATILFAIAAVASIIRQADILVPYQMLWYMNFAWSLPVIFLLWKDIKGFLDRRLWGFYAFTTFFAIYCIAMQTATGRTYLGKDLYNVVVSTGIMATSFVYWKNYGNRRNIHFILQCLLLLTAASALKLLITVIPEIDYSTYQGGYYQKNSVSFMFLSVITICWAEIHGSQRKERIWWYAAMAIIIAVIICLRSRATYLGLAFVTTYAILTIKTDRLRIYAITCVAFGMSMIFFIPGLHDFFIDKLVMSARTLDNPDLFFSYRLGYISNELELMNGLWWLGKGCVYLDCFPIAIAIQYGAAGAMIVFALLTYVGWTIHNAHPAKAAYLKEAAILLFWSFIIISIFEAHVPFGTGIKCFLLWISIGILSAQRSVNPTKHK